jgi:hypothetical protein
MTTDYYSKASATGGLSLVWPLALVSFLRANDFREFFKGEVGE